MLYTVIVNDYSNSVPHPEVRSIKGEGDSLIDAASMAEITVASETWDRRYPGRGEAFEIGTKEADEDWIDCMESVSVLAVIEGHPPVALADDIYM